tara:strand:- start:477 stop:602 length:126 start_codon:yes stop_codon:yes gene_type:complete
MEGLIFSLCYFQGFGFDHLPPALSLSLYSPMRGQALQAKEG